MVCYFASVQKRFSKSLVTPDISGLRSASSACFTLGTKSSSFILMSTALSPPADSRSITPAGFDPVLDSFSRSRCSGACFAVSSSRLLSLRSNMTSFIFLVIWRGSLNPQIFASWLRPLFRKDWVVYSKPPFGGPEYVLQYLGRYTHRVAISNHRLVSLADGQVTFRWRDSAHNNEQKLMTLSIDEFLRAASCCICSLSASSAFATWASSPTDGARFCCHFASQHSVRYRHKLNQKYPPIILLAIASCALTVVPRW